MGNARSQFFWGLALTIGLAADAGRLSAGPGFGSIRKHKVELQIRQPATVRLANTSIAFKGAASSQQYAPVIDSLLAMLETEVFANEKTLVKKEASAADWVLALKVTGFSLPNPATREQQIGNSFTSCVHWTGSLSVSYEVMDHVGHAHDANNVSSSYDREFDTSGRGGCITTPVQPSSARAISHIPVPFRKKSIESAPHTADDVKQILIRDVVHRIAAKLGNTSETIEVQIAAGDDPMNRAAEFLEKKLWGRALEELDKTPAYPKPEEEAYRQYDRGVAYEGTAYDAKSSSEQRESLFKAQDCYDQALELNRKEKYFVDTVARTRDTVAQYKTLEAMQRDDQKQKQAKTAPPPSTSGNTVAISSVSSEAPTRSFQQNSAAAKTAKTIVIGDVIEMYTAGVPDDQIVEIIRSSPIEFNPLDKDTAVAIAKAKLPVRIQNEMRKKVGAAPIGQAAKPAAKASPQATPAAATPNAVVNQKKQ